MHASNFVICKVSIVDHHQSTMLAALDRRLMHLNYLKSLAEQELPFVFGGKFLENPNELGTCLCNWLL